MWSSHLAFHPEGEVYTFARMVNLKQHGWVVEVENYEDMGKIYIYIYKGLGCLVAKYLSLVLLCKYPFE